jgi:hypothetical protein
MEKIKENVFQVDSAIVQEARTLDNYLIIVDEKNSAEETQICAVYFASNYIYYPNTADSFQKAILNKNRFEWWNLKHPKATKHIFIRDIYKQWYLHGINNKINSLEKLADFLEKEIRGYTSYFIGSSAGGYAAVLLGSLLNVNRVYAFNNQFYLHDLLESSSAAVDPLIFREQDNSKINKYYTIKEFIKEPEKVYYFHSNRSDWDVRQFKAVQDLKMNVVSVNTNIHGIPLLKNNLITLFSLDEPELQKLAIKTLNPIKFSIKIIGFFETLLFLFKLLPNAYNRWLYNPIISFLKNKK